MAKELFILREDTTVANSNKTFAKIVRKELKYC